MHYHGKTDESTNTLYSSIATSPLENLCNFQSVGFAHGTLVHGNGSVSLIGDIQQHHTVWSFDDEFNSTQLSTVSSLIESTASPSVCGHRQLVEVRLSNGETFLCGKHQRWFVHQRGWFSAHILNTNHQLQDFLGHPINIDYVGFVQDDVTSSLSFEVAHHHSYYVGNTAVLVHNPDNGDPNDAGHADAALFGKNTINAAGKYSKLQRMFSSKGTVDSHHIPGKGAFSNFFNYITGTQQPISNGQKCAISMHQEDHQNTANIGSKPEAKGYQALQSYYIENNQFDKALEMDMHDVQRVAGAGVAADKHAYDAGLGKALLCSQEMGAIDQNAVNRLAKQYLKPNTMKSIVKNLGGLLGMIMKRGRGFF